MLNCCQKSNRPRIDNPVTSELLYSALNGGEVDDHDYLAISAVVLDKYQQQKHKKDEDLFRNENFFIWFERERLLDISNLNMEYGYSRLSDGCWCVATNTLFDNCTGEMFSWWLNYCDNSEKFRWWHPKNNIQAGWDPQFYATNIRNRSADHNVNHSFITKQIIGRNKYHFHIDFKNPSDYFNITYLKEKHITALHVGRLCCYDYHLGDTAIGYVVYMFTQNPETQKGELRTRYWIGDFEKINPKFSLRRVFNYFTNTWIFRKLKLTKRDIFEFYLHTVEMNDCLNSFIFNLYQEELQNKMYSNISSTVPEAKQEEEEDHRLFPLNTTTNSLYNRNKSKNTDSNRSYPNSSNNYQPTDLSSLSNLSNNNNNNNSNNNAGKLPMKIKTNIIASSSSISNSPKSIISNNSNFNTTSSTSNSYHNSHVNNQQQKQQQQQHQSKKSAASFYDFDSTADVDIDVDVEAGGETDSYKVD